MSMFARVRVFAVAAILAAAASAPAQCTTPWVSMGVAPGANLWVHAAAKWDPDGAGPAAEQLVIAGRFSAVAGVPASRIAAWDPATGAWSALGSGLANGFFESFVQALAVMPNGDLVAAGSFGTAGGAPVSNIARWNGTSWSPIGQGLPDWTLALAVMPNGDLVAGGWFGISRWDGSTWSPLGGGILGLVHALAVMPNGDLVAGGNFGSAGGVAASNVARWNGAAWAPLGAGVDQWVLALAVLPGGDLVAGGTFLNAGATAASCIARWNGATWSALAGGVSSSPSLRVSSLLVRPGGELLVAGTFQLAGGMPASHVARWNGNAWAPLGAGTNWPVEALAHMPGGDVAAVGTFTVAGGVAANRVARWNGASWSPLTPGPGPSDTVLAVLASPNGALTAAGEFTAIGGIAAAGIAQFDGTSWSAMGAGVGPNTGVRALARLHNGDIVASVSPASPPWGSVLRRWNGTSWSTIGAADDIVFAMTVLANGDLVVGGWFWSIGGIAAARIARWNGTTWSALGSGLDGSVGTIAQLPNGDLVVGGQFTAAGGASANGIARWNGSTWSPLGAGLTLFAPPPVGPQSAFGSSIAVLPGGDIVVVGFFDLAGGNPVNNLARWNGGSWSAVGGGIPGVPVDVRVLPDGDLVVCGAFESAGGVAARNVARWDGAAWAPVGAGVSGVQFSVIACAAQLPDGDLLVGGWFDEAGGTGSTNLARLTTTCPASAQPAGAGCPSSGGSNGLTAVLPWTGSTWRADGTGLPPNALVMLVTGFQPISLPLLSVFASAQPGCTLHVQPDHVGAAITSSGTAFAQILLPNSPSLAGIVFHHQMVPLALDGTLAVTATNALRMTIGSF